MEITLNVPVKGEPKRQLVSIRSSGVTCDTTNDTVDTDRLTNFVFEHGTGHSTGASYDPNSRVLVMKSQVQLDWKPAHPNAKPIKIEAGSLIYHETKSEIWLTPWGRLTRGDTVVEGQQDVVRIHEVTGADGKKRTVIRQVEAVKARGSDSYPDRNLQYSADWLLADFDDEGVTRKITGRGGAQLTSTSPATATDVKAGSVDMEFASRNDESVLEHVAATENVVVTSRPLPAPGRQLSETHVLRSQSVDMKMREGGRDMETVVTHAPGTLEFLPNLPTQHHRTLDGNDMAIAYGAAEPHRIFPYHQRAHPHRSHRRRAQTQPRFPPPPPAGSWRRVSIRRPAKMAAMEQTGDFTYDEGDRHARAAKATLDSEQNVILLDDVGARVGLHRLHFRRPHPAWTSAPAISPPKATSIPAACPIRTRRRTRICSPAMSRCRPRRARWNPADDRQPHAIHYEGDAVMWQGANRIQADAIDVDRESARSRPMATWSPTCGNSPKDAAGQPWPEEARRQPRADRGARAAPGLYRREPPGGLHRAASRWTARGL